VKKFNQWLGVSSAVILAAVAAPAYAVELSFDKDGRLPVGWKADATGGKPADWQVVRDAKAVSAPHVLSIVRINDKARGNFNLFWSPGVRFHDGNITVNVRANGGDIDQGGGLIWRVLDGNNYYIARYNPLERNLRLYYVKDGARKLLADAPGLTIGSHEWFALKVAHHGARIRVWLNDQKLIEATDDTFPGPGGVGVWAKADAASSFDNLSVRHARGMPAIEE
jgi:hypothetical protein